MSGILSARAAVVLAHVAALGLLAWAAWSVGQRLPYFSDRSEEQTRVAVSRDQTPRSAAVPVAAVEAAHLFGTKPVEGAQPSAVDAPETRLKLTLTGVFASPRKMIAHAIIEVEAQPPKSYGVGDSIEQTDAKLHSVEANRVLLDRNGQLEALLLVRNDLPETPLLGAAGVAAAVSPSEAASLEERKAEILKRALESRGTASF